MDATPTPPTSSPAAAASSSSSSSSPAQQGNALERISIDTSNMDEATATYFSLTPMQKAMVHGPTESTILRYAASKYHDALPLLDAEAKRRQEAERAIEENARKEAQTYLPNIQPYLAKHQLAPEQAEETALAIFKSELTGPMVSGLVNEKMDALKELDAVREERDRLLAAVQSMSSTPATTGKRAAPASLPMAQRRATETSVSASASATPAAAATPAVATPASTPAAVAPTPSKLQVPQLPMISINVNDPRKDPHYNDPRGVARLTPMTRREISVSNSRAHANPYMDQSVLQTRLGAEPTFGWDHSHQFGSSFMPQVPGIDKPALALQTGIDADGAPRHRWLAVAGHAGNAIQRPMA